MLESDVTKSNIDVSSDIELYFMSLKLFRVSHGILFSYGFFQEFCSRLFQGTIAPYFNSEKIPDDNVRIIFNFQFDDLLIF